MNPTHRSPRILLCRLSAIGDCVLTVPTACALRDRFPDAFLAWAVGPGPGSLLAGHAALDELIVVERDWWKSPIKAWRLIRRLRSLRFDAAIDVQGLTKSAVLARLSGAKRRIGFAPPVGREASIWLNNEFIGPRSRHVVDRYRELLRPLGIAALPPVRFDLPHDQRAEEAVARRRTAAKLLGNYAVVNVGAGWGSKVWPAESYAQTVRHLNARHGLPSLVVWAGSQEREMAETVVRLAGEGATLAPATSLVELAAWLRSATIFVGSDTGPLHLAAALGVPCVGLYGPTNPEVCGPYGPQHIALRAAGATDESIRRAGDDAMQALRPEAASAACDEILGRTTVTLRSA